VSETDDDEKCGFGRPPRRSRFKPGQSGNPKGRRKGTRNLRSDVTTLMNKLVTIHHDGKLRRVSLQEAMLLRMIEKSVGGDILQSSASTMQRRRNRIPSPGTIGPSSNALCVAIFRRHRSRIHRRRMY
jgi:hypothetical protein